MPSVCTTVSGRCCWNLPLTITQPDGLLRMHIGGFCGRRIWSVCIHAQTHTQCVNAPDDWMYCPDGTADDLALHKSANCAFVSPRTCTDRFTTMLLDDTEYVTHAKRSIENDEAFLLSSGIRHLSMAVALTLSVWSSVGGLFLEATFFLKLSCSWSKKHKLTSFTLAQCTHACLIEKHVPLKFNDVEYPL